jgi:hypothetical protein
MNDLALVQLLAVGKAGEAHQCRSPGGFQLPRCHVLSSDRSLRELNRIVKGIFGVVQTCDAGDAINSKTFAQSIPSIESSVWECLSDV